MTRALAMMALLCVLLMPVLAQEGPAGQSAEPSHAAAETAGTHSDGHGDEHGAALGGENATLWKTANFVILVGLGVYLLRGKVGPFFAEHNRSIAKHMASAAARAEEAQQRLTSMEAKLANLGQDIAALKEHAAVEMQRDRERIQHETAAAIQRLQERAEAEIRSAAAHAHVKLRHHASSLALELAEQQVKAEAASPETQGRLLAQAVDRLSRVNEASRN
jgi:F-type H+-transporting ATPase subunit b